MSTPENVTVINAAGQNYAVRDLTPEQALELILNAKWLQFTDGTEREHVTASAATRISVWNQLPSHHGRIWTLTDPSQPKPEPQADKPKRGPGRPRKTDADRSQA